MLLLPTPSLLVPSAGLHAGIHVKPGEFLPGPLEWMNSGFTEAELEKQGLLPNAQAFLKMWSMWSSLEF